MSSESDRSSLAQEMAVRLRELRARRDLTQDQVAVEIDCHESAVSRWESGSRLPSCLDVLALAQLYGVSCDYLLGNREQVVAPGAALLDQALLDRLAEVGTVGEFDRLVDERGEQAAWLPVPEGAVLVPVREAMRRTTQLVERFGDSRFKDRLFRPRS